MNSVRSIRELNKRELEAGISTSGSWHADYRDTAYIYIGGLPYTLSEGDVVTIFSQFGEPVHINLVRDKETGKSKGFAFLKYEDQRSTDLAVDNLGGSELMGRVLRVDHTRYKRKDGEEIQDNTNGDAGRAEKNGQNEESESEEEQRPILKEEVELEELRRTHDDDDPMKQYLIEQKQEEVSKALKEQKKKESKREKDPKRHKRRHGRDRSNEGRERREGRHHSSIDEERDHNDDRRSKDHRKSHKAQRDRSRSPRSESLSDPERRHRHRSRSRDRGKRAYKNDN